RGSVDLAISIIPCSSACGRTSPIRTEDVRVIRAKALGRTAAVAVLAAAALGLSALPAQAGTPARPGKPAPVEPTAPKHRAVRPDARPASTHRVPNELLKESLASDDEDSGPEPNLSAKCQDFINLPNPYGPVKPNVDAIVGDAIVQAGSQLGCSTAQNETT